MDNLLEWLIPLIFAAIYFFGNMFSGKSDEDSAPGVPNRRREEDPDAIERQRRIQEEIRRKIAERRGQSIPDSQNSRPAHHSSAPGSPDSRPAQPQPRLQPGQQPSHTAAASPYETQMQERLRQIEATKKQAERLKQKASALEPQRSSPRASPLTTHQSPLSRASARATLRNPAAARTAFIHAEILGQPISQRKTQTIPGLS